MLNDLKYTVRSREIIDLVAAMRSSRLTLSPYFQRNLVWRETHKRDFIDTILRGYPFPQIFLARGAINLDTMEASQAVVDGQQRLTTIRDFVDGKLEVEGKTFKDMSQRIREEFLKYEVAVIDFDLDAGDERLKDVFHRLNRTFYSLSAIEKLASEYSASEFMLVARVLTGEILKEAPPDDELEGADEDSEVEGLHAAQANIFSRDPGIDEGTWKWLIDQAEGPYQKLIRKKDIFTSFEFDRKVPLMFTLNVMCTYLSGYYSRNSLVRRYLDDKALEFPEEDQIIQVINGAAEYIWELDLPDGALWWNKANFFTLMIELMRQPSLMIDADKARTILQYHSTRLPNDYVLAAQEAVGRKAQREKRGAYLRKWITETNLLF